VDLLNKMLTFNPKERITPNEALKHPFFSLGGSTNKHSFPQDLTLSIQSPDNRFINPKLIIDIHSSRRPVDKTNTYKGYRVDTEDDTHVVDKDGTPQKPKQTIMVERDRHESFVKENLYEPGTTKSSNSFQDRLNSQQPNIKRKYHLIKAKVTQDHFANSEVRTELFNASLFESPLKSGETEESIPQKSNKRMFAQGFEEDLQNDDNPFEIPKERVKKFKDNDGREFTVNEAREIQKSKFYQNIPNFTQNIPSFELTPPYRFKDQDEASMFSRTSLETRSSSLLSSNSRPPLFTTSKMPNNSTSFDQNKSRNHNRNEKMHASSYQKPESIDSEMEIEKKVERSFEEISVNAIKNIKFSGSWIANKTITIFDSLMSKLISKPDTKQ